MPPNIQPAITSHSHTQLPSPKLAANPLTQLNQTMDTRIKTKPSIEQTISNTNIHSRVKGVIENSKKLIEKLKEKAKKTNWLEGMWGGLDCMFTEEITLFWYFSQIYSTYLFSLSSKLLF